MEKSSEVDSISVVFFLLKNKKTNFAMTK